MSKSFLVKRLVLLSFMVCGVGFSLNAQGVVRWLQRGSLQNWFSEKGCEIEEGNVLEQQYGLRWPAQYNYQDLQAAKGFWIGVKDYVDASNAVIPYRVVHVGPRKPGDGEFFPISHDLYARFEPTRVFVDGAPTFSGNEELTDVNPALKADRVLVTVVNTSIGITMTRKIHHFSQQYHDNYHIFEFIFTNTGNTDGDTDIEEPGKSLSGVYFFWQNRYAVVREMGNLVANSARWGINTMNDARGPWYPDPPQNLRAHFAWHGLHPFANKPTLGSFPGASSFDNLGVPVWNPGLSGNLIASSDTTWRLAGSQFVGNVTLHVDKSPIDSSDNPAQPSTTNFIGSDEPITNQNSQFDLVKNTLEYQRMSEGHVNRHAWIVEPSGNFTQPTNDPALGTPGGWSSGNGYGPYTLNPGQSMRIVFAEGADGLSREENIRIGRKFRDGQLNANPALNTKAKNDSVFLGRQRLFDTFTRAVANYNSGFNIPQPPYPPTAFNVTSGGNRITLSWDPNPNEGANGFQGYRIYRAKGRVDSTYRVIFECGSGTAQPSVVYSYDDVDLVRGVSYYYYLTAFGNAAANTGVGLTPPGSLESSRFYTQTYNAAFLKRPAGRPVRDGVGFPAAAIISPKDSVRVDFQYANNEGGTYLGFSVADFLINLSLQRTIHPDTTKPDSVKIDTIKVKLVAPQGVFPLELRGTPVGTTKRSGFYFDTTSITAVVGVSFEIGVYNLLSPGELKLMINGIEVSVPSSVISPFKRESDAFRIAPNPYIISSAENVLRFPSEPDKIAFFNIPGNCTIRIFTELGELIKEIDHKDGSGDAYWNSITSSGQVVVSGIYIVLVENRDTGERFTRKLVIVR